MKKFFVVVFAGILMSCATNKGGYKSEQELENRLLQLDEAEIAIKLGAPTDKNKLSDGTDVWTYRDEAKGLTGGQCAITVFISNGRIKKANVVAKDRSFVSYPLGSCKNIIGNLD